jgi:hypothetical protein
MAHAKRNTLRHSKIELERQQRDEQPEVPGATGTKEDVSPETPKERAGRRRGRTTKRPADNMPAP